MISPRILLLAGLTLVMAACGVQSPRRSSPQEVLTTAELRADHSLLVPTPKVDILFVVDNSTSMEIHQIDLANSISQFVDEFSSKATLDYHIGVVTIWDSHPGDSEAVAAKHPKGALLPLQIPVDSSPENLKNLSAYTGAKQPLLINGQTPPRFVTRDTPQAVPVLKSTLIVGEDEGPQFEEMFSPVAAFFLPENLNGPNAGFLRPDAYLLVVFITDANDSSLDVTSEDLKNDLIAAKGGDASKVRTYAILSYGPASSNQKGQAHSRKHPSDPKNSCAEDSAGRPWKFFEFLDKTGGQKASLCSPSFGAQLASYARDFSTEVSRQVIPITELPDGNQTFQVSYGSQIIPKASANHLDEGWSYNPSNPRITIGANVKLNPEPGAQIKIDLTPITLQNLPKSTVISPPQEPAPQAAVR